MTLTMSVMCMSRSTSRLIRCDRSPRPVSVGVKTLWPRRSRRSETRRQHQPPCEAPCTSTKVWRRAAAGCAFASTASAAPPASSARRVGFIAGRRFSAIATFFQRPVLLCRRDDEAVLAIGQELDLVAPALRHEVATLGAELFVELWPEQRVAGDRRNVDVRTVEAKSLHGGVGIGALVVLDDRRAEAVAD